jgi:hypothetical protein
VKKQIAPEIIDPLTRGAELLRGVQKKRLEGKAEPVRELQETLRQELIARADAVMDEMRKLSDQYGRKLAELIGFDWKAFYPRVPEKLMRDFQRFVLAAANLPGNVVATLSAIPDRIAALTDDDDLRVEAARLRYDVRSQEGAPEAFREKITRIEYLLSEIESRLTADDSEAAVTWLNTRQPEPRTAVQAETAYSPLGR